MNRGHTFLKFKLGRKMCQLINLVYIFRLHIFIRKIPLFNEASALVLSFRLNATLLSTKTSRFPFLILSDTVCHLLSFSLLLFTLRRRRVSFKLPNNCSASLPPISNSPFLTLREINSPSYLDDERKNCKFFEFFSTETLARSRFHQQGQN